ncbi:MAG TPA: glycoside hydrolase family 16 protein [Vicinamibacterales bacterium]|nr:glycoside hydrolase family 16 protein [Vicinamibacterales bacterium]
MWRTAVACVLTVGWLGSDGERPPQTPASPGESLAMAESLVWQDEFAAEGPPDATRWDYEVGLIRNDERQYYTRNRRENARVEGGRLIIEAHRERYEGADYTSASLTSRASWTYGRIEVRAKLPRGRGSWPAIWTLGTNIRDVGWPACGEIDIMEHVGFDPGRVHANIHTKAYNHVQGTNKGHSVLVQGADEDFHVYSAAWSPERIDVSIDGMRYFTFAKEATGGDAVWPFDKAQYLILNLAIGGSWGGRNGIDDAAFPMRYEIDYVRVYR